MKCLHCNKQFVGKYSKNKYCSQRCAREAWYLRNPNYRKEKWQEYKITHPNKEKVTKVCALCGSLFDTVHDNSLYCSKVCRGRANTKRQRERYPERHAADRAKRRSRVSGLASTLTKTDWKQTVAYFDSKCVYCGNTEKLHQEHFIPLALGGEYTKNNIVPACRTCNSKKGAKHPAEWCPPDVYMKIQTYLERNLP